MLHDKSKGYEIREQITEMLKPLLVKYPEIVLDGIVELWNEECKYTNYPPEHEESSVLRKIIEIMVTIGIKVEKFVAYLSSSRRLKKVTDYYNDLAKTKKFGYLNQKVADIEGRLLFLLYSFTSYNKLEYIEDSEKRKNYLYDLWMQLCTFLKYFKNP